MSIWIIISPLIIALTIVGLTVSNRQRMVGREGIETPELSRAYDRVNRWPPFRFFRFIVVNTVKRCKTSGKLLDIGCGPGYLTMALKRRCPNLKITGMDISKEMVGQAAGNLTKLGFQDIEIKQGDVRAMPFDGATFDFAVSTMSLHHWSDPIASFADIHRVLKPGGYFILLDVRRNICRFFSFFIWFIQNLVLPKALRDANEPTVSIYSGYTPAEIERFVNESGFKKWRISIGPLWTLAVVRK